MWLRWPPRYTYAINNHIVQNKARAKYCTNNTWTTKLGMIKRRCNHGHDYHYDHDIHDDVIKWKYFPRRWPFVWGINRSPVNSPRKGQWRRALMFSFICAWINGWVNNREAGDCPACRTTLIATRFWVVMICPIIKCLTVLWIFFYFVWFVFIHHNFQFYFELCTYCDVLDI